MKQAKNKETKKTAVSAVNTQKQVKETDSSGGLRILSKLCL